MRRRGAIRDGFTVPELMPSRSSLIGREDGGRDRWWNTQQDEDDSQADTQPAPDWLIHKGGQEVSGESKKLGAVIYGVDGPGFCWYHHSHTHTHTGGVWARQNQPAKKKAVTMATSRS